MENVRTYNKTIEYGLDNDNSLERDMDYENSEETRENDGSGVKNATSAPASPAETQYMNEIGKSARLTPEEEEILGWKIFYGNQAAEQLLAETDSVNRVELTALVEDGKKAQAMLVHANLRLVVSQAKKYKTADFDLMDLVQEGNIGLMRAAGKFDISLGNRFSTYAVWWIKQAIWRAICSTGKMVRIPEYVKLAKNKITRAEQEIARETGRTATSEAIAERTGLSVDKVNEVRSYIWAVGSLDETIGDDENLTKGEMVKDENTITPEEYMEKEALSDAIQEVFEHLSKKEAEVLRLRAGIGEERAFTLDEIGQRYGVTRERIRQIEARAIKKIKSVPSLREKLSEFYYAAPAA